MKIKPGRIAGPDTKANAYYQSTKKQEIGNKNKVNCSKMLTIEQVSKTKNK